MARRRITVDDDAEILVHWRAGRGIRQIARSLGYARNTVRERIAEATVAGFGREGPALSAAEWRAALTSTAAEGDDGAGRFPARAALEPLHDEIAAALQASTMTTVWQRLRDDGRTSVSFWGGPPSSPRARSRSSSTWRSQAPRSWGCPSPPGR